MLRQREKASLSVIALACGFADQSHFTRVFTRRVGLSPGAWRRRVAG
jgi:AraC-like DNA-binding protein